MKKVIIITIVLVLAIICLFVLSFFSKKETDITNIQSFTFEYTTDMSYTGGVEYNIYSDTREGYIITYKADGVEERNKIHETMSKEQVKEFEKLLTKLKVSSWNGFNEIDRFVLDGNSFSMSITYGDKHNKKRLYAHGYMKYPPNYDKVKAEIEEFLKDVIKKR